MTYKYLGKPFEWSGDADAQQTELIYNDETIQVNPRNIGGAISLSYTGYEWEPGLVTITDGEKIYKTAVNLSKSESSFNSERALSPEVSDRINIVDAGALTSTEITSEIKTSGFGKEIWHWFMLAGFLLLVTESLVSIFYKAETVT